MCMALCACVHPEAARGRKALDEHAYAAASRALEAAVRDRPGELSYWVDLGRAYVGQGGTTFIRNTEVTEARYRWVSVREIAAP